MRIFSLSHLDKFPLVETGHFTYAILDSITFDVYSNFKITLESRGLLKKRFFISGILK